MYSMPVTERIRSLSLSFSFLSSTPPTLPFLSSSYTVTKPLVVLPPHLKNKHAIHHLSSSYLSNLSPLFFNWTHTHTCTLELLFIRWGFMPEGKELKDPRGNDRRGQQNSCVINHTKKGQAPRENPSLLQRPATQAKVDSPSYLPCSRLTRSSKLLVCVHTPL